MHLDPSIVIKQLMLLAHLLGMVLWVGGMAFAHLCLRPEVAKLDPPVRLPLLAGVLGRFFRLVFVALALIWTSGTWLFAASGREPGSAPAGWYVMVIVAAVMTLVFLVIRFKWYPAMTAAIAAKHLPVAGQAMASIRQWVGINLALGILVVVAATLFGH